jgi:uncharacterized membrane protein YebE (DUF533 family)
MASSMAELAANAQQKEAFIDELVKAMATSCIPFTFMENSYLNEAAQAPGVELPSRRALAGQRRGLGWDRQVLAG